MLPLFFSLVKHISLVVNPKNFYFIKWERIENIDVHFAPHVRFTPTSPTAKTAKQIESAVKCFFKGNNLTMSWTASTRSNSLCEK